MRRKKKNTSSVLFLLFLMAIIAGVVYLYNSETFERTKPEVTLDDEIFWNLKKPIQLKIEDQSGIAYYKVILATQDGEKVLNSKRFEIPSEHKEVTIDVHYPKVGGYLKTSEAKLIVEAVDASKWDFFAGNKVVEKRTVIIDQRKPIVSTIANSYGITRGGSALVVFQAKDENLDHLYIDTNFGKAFIPQPFYKEGYYISLVAWPIQQRRFHATVIAEDKAGNISRSSLRFEVRNRRYRTSKITLKDHFLQGKIAELASELEETQGVDDPLKQFELINETVRAHNEKVIHDVTSRVPTSTVSNFNIAPFYPLENAKAVASFGDKRYYYYHRKKVSTSYHLGIDLASVQMADVKTRNPATVVFAEPNGIYGNLPILHHGLGLYSLYGHCSSLAVNVGDTLKRGDVIAHTGKTGLALGDHLHFGMLVQGIEVRPAEWMDRQWIKLNITEVIKAAKGIIDRS